MTGTSKVFAFTDVSDKEGNTLKNPLQGLKMDSFEIKVFLPYSLLSDTWTTKKERKKNLFFVFSVSILGHFWVAKSCETGLYESSDFILIYEILNFTFVKNQTALWYKN